MKTVTLQAAARTDIGCVRLNNEDHFGCDLERGIFVVCDGMGGQAAGEVASKLAVESLLEYFCVPSNGHRSSGEVTDAAEALAAAVRGANQRIFQAAGRNRRLTGMGSTIVAVLIQDGSAHIAHVGDSRAYLIRAGEIRQLTEDHSIVMEQVRRGLMTREQAAHSDLQNVITRALGSQSSVQVDLQELEASNGDLLLLTTDGLTRGVSDARILQLVQSASDLEQSCDALVNAARSAGGEDNITCVLLRITDSA